MTTATPSMAMAEAEIEIKAAWQAYKQVEKYGLEFGKTVYKWREKFASQSGGIGTKGKGLSPILDTIGIPKSTAYWWISRYEISVGLRAPDPPPDPPKEFEDYEDEDAFDGDFLTSDLSDEDIEKLLEAGRKREAKWAAQLPSFKSKPTPEVRKLAEVLVEAGYRFLAKRLHPDAGGDHDGMSNLNAAVAFLRSQILSTS